MLLIVNPVWRKEQDLYHIKLLIFSLVLFHLFSFL